jgi:hypothetical protein
VAGSEGWGWAGVAGAGVAGWSGWAGGTDGTQAEGGAPLGGTPATGLGRRTPLAMRAMTATAMTVMTAGTERR